MESVLTLAGLPLLALGLLITFVVVPALSPPTRRQAPERRRWRSGGAVVRQTSYVNPGRAPTREAIIRYGAERFQESLGRRLGLDDEIRGRGELARRVIEESERRGSPAPVYVAYPDPFAFGPDGKTMYDLVQERLQLVIQKSRQEGMMVEVTEEELAQLDWNIDTSPLSKAPDSILPYSVRYTVPNPFYIQGDSFDGEPRIEYLY